MYLIDMYGYFLIAILKVYKEIIINNYAGAGVFLKCNTVMECSDVMTSEDIFITFLYFFMLDSSNNF